MTINWLFRELEDESEIDVTIIGIPYEKGGCYRLGASDTPDKIRELAVNFAPVTEAGQLLRELTIKDAGDIVPSAGPEEMLELIRQKTKELFLESFLIVIGGDHSITGGMINALGDSSPKGSVGIIYFDAHTDLSHKFANTLYSHASALRRGLEHPSIEPADVFLVGVRSFEEEPLKYIQENSVKYLDATTVETMGTEKVSQQIVEYFRKKDNVYISMDIDILDPAFAPGTGIPEPGGLSTRQLLMILRGLWPLNLVGADLTEISPSNDLDNLTSMVGVKLIKEVLGLVLKRKRLGLKTSLLKK